MKKLLLFTCALLIDATVYSQEITLEYHPGYGTYNMSGMKEHLKNIPHYSRFEGMKFTDKFPGNLSHDLRMGYLINRHHFGVLFSHMNTAGQIHLADYSGEYRYRVHLYGNKLGVFYRFSPTKPDKFTPFFELSTGGVFNIVNIHEVFTIGDRISKNEKTKLKGTNLFVQPALGVIYRFCSFASTSASVGYEWNPLTRLSIKGNKATIDADWTGLRINAGIITYFNAK
ncbi:hypothetical protein [Bacteroides sp. UBA939]|uniref:hypothetical protein n=1 Tax=Bacteroides sp. UBA939 TaxID=1946092 RepID=UPI0025C5C817|nr:hypothetical protein [Bacteroides sp. UBA939]